MTFEGGEGVQDSVGWNRSFSVELTQPMVSPALGSGCGDLKYMLAAAELVT